MKTINFEETELFKSLLLNHKDANYVTSIKNCINECKLFLQKYHLNFSEYTDHSIFHSFSVLKFASKLLLKEDLDNLNSEEKYILIMACILHDIGMSVQSDSIFRFISKDLFNEFKKGRKEEDKKKILTDFIREYHHIISYQFIIQEYKTLHIIDEKFAEAIAIVAKNHRDLPILDPLKSSVFHIGINGIGIKVCLTYLSCILLIADELDIPRTKIPELIKLYHWPKNPISELEYQKHLGILQVNFTPPYIEIEGYCDKPKIYYEILSLIEKIESKIKESNKLIRFLPKIREKNYLLSYSGITKNIKSKGFLPKKIKFSINTEQVFKRFMENNLYNDSFITIREAILNSIDICRYKKFLNSSYHPQIKCTLETDSIIIEDNGLGMDEFIITNFFSCLGGSYYNFKKSEIPYNITAQFGIGVFAYFLICDRFKVNTKMQGKLSLHFDVYKDTDSYFYFHENDDNDKEGTKIVFFLKPSFTSNINLNLISSQLKEHFQYVEIPISLKCSGKEEIISCKDIDFSLHEIYLNSYNYHKIKDNFDEHIITSLNEKSENYEITLGFHPLIEFYQKPEHHFLFYNEPYKPINIYYKGVFLNKMKGIILSHYSLIGAINILKEESLQLNRSRFVNEEFINKILITYEYTFLKKLLVNISRTIKNEQVEEFLHFINIPQIPFNDLSFFNNLSFIRVRAKKTSFSLFSINELLENYEELLYVPGILGDVGFSKQLYVNFNLPVITPRNDMGDVKNLVFDVIIKSFKLRLEKYKDKKYFIIKRGKVKELKFFEFDSNNIEDFYNNKFKIYFTEIQSDCFISYFYLDYATPILIFNTNNPVSKYILKKMDYINENLQLKKLFLEITNRFEYAYFSAYRDKEFRDKLKIFYDLLQIKKVITFDNFVLSLKEI